MKRLLMTVVSMSVSLAWADEADDKGRTFAKRLWEQNAGYQDLVGDVEMVLVDADGTEAKRSFKLKVLERPTAQDGERSLIVFDTPADVKGTAVLSHGMADGEDEQWLYVPSAKRTRRISSSNKSGAFVGSEFSFEDLTGNDGRKYRWRFVRDVPCGQKTCVELESVPLDAGSSYSKRLVTVSADDLRVQTVAFFDRKGELLKTLTYGEYQVFNERFARARTWTMANAQTNKRTTLKFVSMRLGTGLSATDFAPAKLGN